MMNPKMSNNMTQDENNISATGPAVPGKESDAFYIGWMAAAPRLFARFIRKYLLTILPLIILLAGILAVSQKKFGTGNFEFGQLTEVTGIYFKDPVPCIKVVNGKDIWGNLSCITIPLVGYGKHGAVGMMADIESEKNISLNKKRLTLKGTLLYNDGKTILQVNKNDRLLLKVSDLPVPPDLLPQKRELGSFTVKGEIIDPKCYFGVMKPGEGKVHRDCAIRCILGGIPPMLAVKNDRGESNYYILVGPNGEPMNQAVQDFVAEPVEIKARLVQQDDWIVAYMEKKDGIHRFSNLQAKFGNSVQYCSVNCAK
jgi:hypothetical protein